MYLLESIEMTAMYMCVFPDLTSSVLRMGEVYSLLLKNPGILSHCLLPSLPIQPLQSTTAVCLLYPKHTCPQDFVSMVIAFLRGTITSPWGDDFFFPLPLSPSYLPWVHNRPRDLLKLSIKS